MQGPAASGAAASPPRAARPTTAQDSRPRIEVPDRPRLAPGIELRGQMTESAFKDPPYLIERDRSYIQVPRLLYLVAEHADGEHDLEAIAAALSEAVDRDVTADNVRQFVTNLMALGIVLGADGQPLPGTRTADDGPRSPLRINMRVHMLGPRFIDPATAVFQFLFWPPVLLAALGAIFGAQAWLFVVHGVGDSLHDALYTPGLLGILLLVMISSAAYHEFGHAAALRYGGGRSAGMGAGLYLVYPAFYTDVSDNYRLPRWSRVRTDLAGFYFHLLFALGMMGLYVLTGHEFLLLAVVLIDYEIIHQLMPFIRLDGYWTLADVTGFPDFFSQMGAFLRGLLPGWVPFPEGRRLPPLKLWAKLFFAAYILVTVPLLAFVLFLMVKAVPRVLATTWDAVGEHAGKAQDAFAAAHYLEAAGYMGQVALLALPALALGYTLYSLARRVVFGLWRWARPSAGRRVVAGLVTASVAALLVLLWAPSLPLGLGGGHGALYRQTRAQFTPIREGERLTVGDVVQGRVAEAAASPTATPTPTPSPTPSPSPTPGGSPSATPPATRTVGPVATAPALTPAAPAFVPATAPAVVPTSVPAAPPAATATVEATQPAASTPIAVTATVTPTLPPTPTRTP